MHISGLFYTVRGSVQSTTGIGHQANPIPSVHHWPAAVSEAPPADSSCLCWRHSNLPLSPTRRFCRALWESDHLCWWGFSLDGIQSAAAESHTHQEWGLLVLIFTSTTPDSIWSGPHWQHWRAASSQFLRSAISVSTSTLTWPWWPTSQPLSECASWLCIRSGACVNYCHNMPCWPGSCTDCQQGGLLQLGSRWYL